MARPSRLQALGVDREVTVVVDGPGVLAGFGSAAAAIEESHLDDVRTTIDGRALAVVRPTGPGTISATAWGSRLRGCDGDGRGAVSRRLGWAVVGTGGISRTTAGDLHRTEELDLLAVASRTIDNAAAFAADFEVPRAYGDYDSLFADDDIDVVYIATPIATHAELARRALMAGKHVLVEKAFTTTAAEARVLAALAAEQGRFLMEAMWMRFNPAIDLMLGELDGGAVGDVLSVQAGFGIPFPRTTNIWRPELGGGALLDMGVYPLTLVDLVLGPPDTLEASGEIRPDGLDVTASVLLGYGDGRFAHALTSLAGPVNPVASIGGTEGILSFDAPFFATDSFTVVQWPDMEARTVTVGIEGAGYVPMFRAVCEAIQDGLLEHPLRPLRDTIDVLKTMDEVRRQLTALGAGTLR